MIEFHFSDGTWAAGRTKISLPRGVSFSPALPRPRGWKRARARQCASAYMRAYALRQRGRVGWPVVREISSAGFGGRALGRLRAAVPAHTRSDSKRLTASRFPPHPPPPLANPAHPKHYPERAPASPAADDVSTWVPARLACFRRRSDDFALSPLSLHRTTLFFFRRPTLPPPTIYPPDCRGRIP